MTLSHIHIQAHIFFSTEDPTLFARHIPKTLIRFDIERLLQLRQAANHSHSHSYSYNHPSHWCLSTVVA